MILGAAKSIDGPAESPASSNPESVQSRSKYKMKRKSLPDTALRIETVNATLGCTVTFKLISRLPFKELTKNGISLSVVLSLQQKKSRQLVWNKPGSSLNILYVPPLRKRIIDLPEVKPGNGTERHL